MHYSKKCSLQLWLLISLYGLQQFNVIGMSADSPEMDDLTKLDQETYCMFQSNLNQCTNKSVSPSYYYDITRKECVLSKHGGCPDSYNNHATYDICKTHCKENFVSHQRNLSLKSNVYCRFQPDFGSCFTYVPLFYFDINTRTCKGFSYSGCGGNLNRFPNTQICIAVCSPAVNQDIIPKKSKEYTT